MKNYFFVLVSILELSACKTQPGSNRHYADGDDNRVYRIRLNPAPGSTYYYEVNSESDMKLKANGTDVEKLTRSTVAADYKISKDSARNFLCTVTYDKIHIYTKKDDVETELDAANGPNSLDPVEKMLGFLKATPITATVSPSGELRSVAGYQQLTALILTGFHNNDANARLQLEQQCEKIIGEGIVNKSISQLFSFFPDSTVHIGDRWKLSSTDKGEFNLCSKGNYILKEIDDGVALIRSEAEMHSDSIPANLMGYNVSTNLSGTQHGQFEIQTSTGMLIGSEMSMEIHGTIQMSGMEVPVSIEANVKVKGQTR